jgi:hypothetical protein
MFRNRKIVLLILCAATVCGCSSADRKLKAKGKVVKGGVPFTVPAEEYVRVTFYPMAADGSQPKNSYVAVYDRNDGNFTVVGPDGKGVPPGKYRVAVEHERKRKDLFQGEYDADRSPFVVEVNSSSQDIVIDLATKGGPPIPEESDRRERGR